ncbi:hypothetical protein ABZ348_30865 [Streptomyces sp. NPDC005963]|uniref:hypothetical protein n=1 Tax=Streptomyces sp. NPDC005963 TaxID=3156721 RepID=UPI0034115704
MKPIDAALAAARKAMNAKVGRLFPGDLVHELTDVVVGAWSSAFLVAYADELERHFPDPNPLASVFQPYVVTRIAENTRKLATAYEVLARPDSEATK